MAGPVLRPQDLRNQNQRNANADRQPVPVGWGPGEFQPSQPQGVGSENSRRIALPGENFPPAGAIPVDRIFEANIASMSTGVVVTIQVPDTYRFRIAGLGVGAEDEAALRFTSWSTMVNPPSAPVYGYFDMPTGIGSIQYPAWVFIVLGSSVVFTLSLTNGTNAGTYHYFVRVQGWFYSEKDGQ